MNISLLTSDHQAIEKGNWLQFDGKNREFYGIPKKAQRDEYHLTCSDSSGLTATDSLVIVVHPSPKVHYNVEFRMSVVFPFDSFANNAFIQRKFLEKLQVRYLSGNF